MAGVVREVPFGDGARRALLGALEAAKGGDRLAPVAVVAGRHDLVPVLRQFLADAAWAGERRRGEAAHRLAPAFLSSVRYFTLSTLAERLAAGSPRLEGRWPLSRAALLGLARTALESVGDPLAAVRAHPQTASSVARWYRVRRGLAADDEPVRELEMPAALAVVERVRALVERGWYDDLDALVAAAEAVEAGTASRGELGTVLVHLPARLVEAEVRLLAALARTGGLVVLLPAGGVPGGPSEPRLGARDLATALGPDVVAEPADAGDGTWPPASSAGADRVAVALDGLIEAPDEQAEARAAVRLVLSHLEGGLEARRCAIAYPEGTAYGSLLAEQLLRAGLEWNGPSPWRIKDGPLARLLLGALALARRRPLAADALFDWLRSAPVLDGAGTPPPVGEWERCAAEAGISVAEPAQWAERLAQVPSPAASSLGSFVEELGSRLDDGRRARGWSALSAWAADLLGRYGPSEPAEGEGDGGGSDLFAGSSRALSELLRSLGELEGAASAGAATGVGLDAFSAVLGVACEAALGGHGRAGRGVTVAPLGVVAHGSYDLVVAVGLADDVLLGRLPPTAAGEESDEAAARRRDLLAALEAGRTSWASWPARRAGASGPCTCSRWLAGTIDPSRTAEVRLSGTAAVLRGLALEARAVIAAGAVVPHPAEALGASAAAVVGRPLDEGELLAALLLSGPSRARDPLCEELVEEAGVGRILACARERDAGVFGAFGGDVGRVVRQPGAPCRGLPASWSTSGLSPSALERLATCPRRYFFRDVLGAIKTTAPGVLAPLPPPVWGQLVHEVLERFVAPVVARDLGGEGGWGEDDATRLLAVAREVFARYERGRPAGPALFRRPLLEDLEEALLRFLEADGERVRASGARPVALEAEFGTTAASPPLVVDLGGGRGPVLLRGRVDRVDALPGGGREVVDYKTGRSPSPRAGADDPLRGGRRVQLAVYGLAVGGATGTPAAPVRCRLAHVRPDVAPEKVFGEAEEIGPETTHHLAEALGVLWDLAAAGLFPPVPGTQPRGRENCDGCDYDGLCEDTRVRVWEQATAAPDGSPLACFAALVRRGS